MNQLLLKKSNEISKKKKKGFTLVELIIVIAIIAILAAIAIPKFGAIKENSNKQSDIANAKNISLAVARAIAEDKVDYSTAISKESLDDVGGADIQNELDGIKSTTTLKTTAHKDDTFTVSVSTTGTITVYAGDDEVYPEAAAAFSTK